MRNYLLLTALLGLASFLLSDCKTVMVKKQGAIGAVRRSQPRSGDEPVVAAYSSGADVQRTYIDQFSQAAVSEMHRTGIPASITLAQGILESGSGQSQLAREANNHFGIKCSAGWTGPTYKKKDDDRDGDGNLIESCFRKYKDPAESFYDHSEFLRDPRKANRYGFLFNLDRRDYQGWAKGLQSAGYATSQTYAAQLISLIERNQLHIYDDASLVPPPVQTGGGQTGNPNTGTPGTDIPATPDPNKPETPAGGIDLPPMQRIRYVNDSKVVFSQQNETLQDIARLYSLPVERLQYYNDNGYSISKQLELNSFVYLQRKHDRWRGRASSHFLKEGQTMFDVSQIYGIRLDPLLKRNNLARGQEPLTGEKILLKTQRPPGDRPRLRSTEMPKPGDVVTTQPTPGTTPPSGDATPSPVTSSPGFDPDESEELFEIGGEPAKPALPANPNPTNPANPSNPTNPATPTQPAPPPPATTDTPYPADNRPPATSWPGSTPSKPATPSLPPDSFYTVEKGDTLFSVARKFGTTVARLKVLNNLTGDYIQAGQKLVIK